MPEFEQEDKTAFKSLVIHFSCIEDMENFAELIEQKITTKTKFMWYPKQEIIHNGIVVTENEA